MKDLSSSWTYWFNVSVVVSACGVFYMAPDTFTPLVSVSCIVAPAIVNIALRKRTQTAVRVK